MNKRLTPTIVICGVAALITAGGLARPPGVAPLDATPAPSSSSSDQVAPTGTPVIEIADFSFRGSLAVSVGQSIDVLNADAVPHTLTSSDGSFDTGILDGGQQSGLVAPVTPGSYAFICEVHPTMTGTLEVS